MRKSLVLPFIIMLAVVIGGLLFLFGGNSFHKTTISTQSPIGNSVSTDGSNTGTKSATPRTSILGIGTHLNDLTVLGQGTAALEISDRVNYRITNQQQLTQLWEMVYSANAPNLPSVDFSKSEVLAVFDGSHSTGGYGIRIDSITDTSKERTITITHVVPGPTCATTDAVSSPFVIVSLKKSALPLTHIENTETSSCQ